MSEMVYVRGDSDSSFEAMTKEQIYTAIVEAVESGTVGDIDTGFVTMIKEMNKGQGLKFWVGTTAEYEAITDKENNVLYIKTDDTTAADISRDFTQVNEAIETIQNNLASLSDQITEVSGGANTHITSVSSTSSLGVVFGAAAAGITIYTVAGVTAGIYPINVPAPSQSSNVAIVTITKASSGSGHMMFEYEGAMYICHFYTNPGGIAYTEWFEITTTSTEA